MNARPIWCRRFIGRAAELGMLAGARRALAQSRGAVVLVGGEAGIGKSRLVSRFLSEVQGGRAGRIARAECVPGGDQPLWPIRSFLRTLAGDDLDAAPAIAQRALAHLVPDVLPPSLRDAYAGTTLGKAELFAGAIAALRHCTARRAAIAVIEDAHWADRSTLEFLAFLAARIAGMRLLLVATYRPDELEARDPLADALSRMLRERSVHRMALEPLSRDDVMDLLAGALGDDLQVGARELGAIAARCDGNPFFAEELLKDAVERLRDGEGGALPAAIRAAIRHRLLRLPAEDRRVIEIAAVLGTRFDPAILARVAERDPASIGATLGRARDANLILEEADGARCRFRHALTRAAIYESLLALDARALHRSVVAVYESLAAPERDLYELAYHAWEAKDVAAAFEYNERAGEAAFAIGALPEAAGCLERARTLARNDDERARVDESAGLVAAAQGELPRAIAAFESALAVRLRDGAYDDAARLVGLAQGERSNAGEVTAPVLTAFIAEYGERLGTGARDRLVAFTARVLCAMYAFDRARALLAGISPSELLPPRVRANAFACRLTMHAYEGDPDAWRAVAEPTRLLVPDLPPVLGAIMLATIAQTGIWLGAEPLVVHALDDADELTARWAIDGVGTFARAVRAQHAYVAGDLAAARDAVEYVLARPEVSVAQACMAVVGPFVARALGDRALAERCLAGDAVRAHLAALGDVAVEDAFIVAAHAALPPAAAGARAEPLIAALRALPPDAPPYPTVLPLCAERVALHDLPEVLRFADPARLRANHRAGRATATLVRAIAARRRGDSAEAERSGREAAAAYRVVGWPLFEARALEAAGDRGAAAALYARCGAAGDLRRVVPRAAEPSAPDAPVAARAVLSAREVQIARLVAQGQTNTAIAEALAVGRKTVEKHVSSVLAKLGLRSRAQIAASVAAGRITEGS